MTNYEFRITNEVVAPTTHGGEVSSFKFQVFSFQQRIEDEDENEDEDEEQMAARMLAGGLRRAADWDNPRSERTAWTE